MNFNEAQGMSPDLGTRLGYGAMQQTFTVFTTETVLCKTPCCLGSFLGQAKYIYSFASATSSI